jgi:gamma-glutamyl hercynylcysteine S-oxide synthase
LRLFIARYPVPTTTATYTAEQFRQDLLQQRSLTLDLVGTIPPDWFNCQAHPDFSPIGWHLGHIGYTEALWLLEHLAQEPAPLPAGIRQLQLLFAADGLPKVDRQNLPELAVILDYLEQVRSQVEAYLDRQAENSPDEATQRLWQFILQHESQHRETMMIVLALLGRAALPTPHTASTELLAIPAGGFWMGNDQVAALDNERPDHWVDRAYRIASQPVTCGEYRQWIDAGGYQTREHWSAAGWDWLQQNGVTQPQYWHLSQVEAVDRPVCGISWYEADAYARAQGQRLPTEAEWEKAVQLAAQQSGPSPFQWGQVWEWTDSWFAAYPDFQAFPYPGYSATYFDQQHRVLRGGSWATHIRRPSFRNWYHPWTRVIFAGLRLCENGDNS